MRLTVTRAPMVHLSFVLALAACGDDAATPADTADTQVPSDASTTTTTETTVADSATETLDDTSSAETATPDSIDPKDPCHYAFSPRVAYVTHLAVASLSEGTIEGAPADHCCFDFDGDSAPDNRMGEIVKLVDALPQTNTTINQVLTDNLADGTLTVLIELVGADSLSAASDATLNVFYGTDTDADHVGNLAGQGTFTADLTSFLPDSATPATTFSGVIVTNGNLYAGPSVFHMALPIAPGLVIEAGVERARIEGLVAEGPSGGITLNGATLGAKLGGVIPQADLFGAFNDFASSRCGCLTLGGADALLTNTGGVWACAATIDSSECDDEVDIERQCKIVAQVCDVALSFVTPDIDTDNQGGPDAFSVGVWIDAVGASIVGVEPSACTPGR